jgi:2-keto-4-pentenoate hydratase/2-oxohepta-3-ene-1,7-dioic acid hydratase in catechol pathway
MRIASPGAEQNSVACVVTPGGALPLDQLNLEFGTRFPTNLFELVAGNYLPELKALLEGHAPAQGLPVDELAWGPPFRRPGKIWGIGLNYREHARDLDEVVPAQPASFMKPATSIIGYGDTIRLPAESERVTAEAELAVIIGRRCRNLSLDEAASAIFGFTCVIDMTAEDILRQNPRYLTRAKSFDTFFSFGPVILTSDEIPDVRELVVRTIVNDEVRAENSVANMTFDPYELVSFHSRGMTLEAGDIISTGTPGAWPLQPGDRVRCEISGFPALENPVEAEVGVDLRGAG